ncbi:MAG: MFS transporter [Peptococcaceae bacterium]|nr:MFS transporter [Peptococcaceae bacterium]
MAGDPAGVPPSGRAAGERPVLWTRDFTLICVYNLVIFISFMILVPTMPLYVKSLGASDFVVGLVVGIFTVSAVLCRLWAGRMLDIYGRRGIWILGGVVFILTAVGYNWALTIPLIMALRVIHGGGWGVVSTASYAAVTDLIPPPRRGEGMGFFGLGNNLSMAFSPALAFYLLGNWGFSILFWIAAALAFLSLLVMATIRLPVIQPRKGGPAPALLEPTALKPSLLMFFGTFTLGGVITFIALYGAQHGIHNVSFYFAAHAVTLVLTRPVAGSLYDRHGEKSVLIAGFLLFSAGMVLLSLPASLTTFLAAAVANGLGYGALQPALQALAVANCGHDRYGAAQATFMAAFDLGIGLGAMGLGMLAQFFGYSGMYLASAGVILSGLLVYLKMGVRCGDETAPLNTALARAPGDN